MHKIKSVSVLSFFLVFTLTSCEQYEKGKSAIESVEKVINGDFISGNDELVKRWAQKLMSSDSSQRADAFGYYLKAKELGGGVIGELFVGPIRNYFLERPQEFLQLFKLLNQDQQATVVDDLAYEFVAKGIEF